MASVETITVILISSRGLRFATVPESRPYAFSLVDPPTRTGARTSLREYLRADLFSYVEQED